MGEQAQIGPSVDGSARDRIGTKLTPVNQGYPKRKVTASTWNRANYLTTKIAVTELPSGSDEYGASC